MIIKKTLGVLSSIAILVLPACSVLPPVDNTQKQYILGQTPPVRLSAKKQARLIVTRPATPAIYDTPQMAYSPRKWEISYFSKNRWGARPAEMIQDLLIQTFEATHAFSTVSKSPIARPNEWILHSEIIRFEEDLTGPVPVFAAALRAELQDSSGHILATRRFNATQPLSSQTPYAMVIAANKAVSDMLHQIDLFFIKKMYSRGL